MAASRSELPQGTLDLLILAAVSLEPLHGYGIGQRLQQYSRDVIQVRQGSLYPALHRLESRGFLSTEWRQSETGRDAKYYSLTPVGAAALDAERTNWRRTARAIAAVLRVAPEDA